MNAKTRTAVPLHIHVAELGEEKFAQKYDVTLRAAKSYRFRARLPRREVALRIVERSKRRVTFDSIYFSADPVRHNGKKGRAR